MDIELIAVVIMAFAAIAAWFAAWQTKTAAGHTRKAALGHMLIELSKQFGSSEMLKSMKILRKWKSKYNISNRQNDFAMVYAGTLKLDNSFAEEVDNARRTYFTFFDTLRILYNRKILNKNDIEEQIGNYSIEMLFEIIEPMELYHAVLEKRDYGHKTFDLFRKWNSKLDEKFPKPKLLNHLVG